MVALLLAGVGLAAQVQCDPLGAAEVLAEARIDEHRAPASHPELVPGLALASPRTEASLREALGALCEPGAALSLVPGEVWQAPGWSARDFKLTRSETRGCTLFQRSIVITVGTSTDTAPRYALRSRLPISRTPVGDCPTSPAYREEQLLGGQEGPVRLVLATDVEEEELVHSEVLVRRATPEGWTEQVLLEPAPPRLTGGFEGPRLVLTERDADKWVVATGDRQGSPVTCQARPGQTVWTPSEEGAWTPHAGRDALALLASRGHWRLAGEDGWLIILAQDEAEDQALLEARVRRVQRRVPEPIRYLPTASFPGLNPGFVVAALGPWPSEEQAQEARRTWKIGRTAYVKRAWEAQDPCDQPPRSP